MDEFLTDLQWVCGSPVVLGVFGLLVGSFLNVVIHRKPIIMMREWLLDTGGMLGEGEVWKQVFAQSGSGSYESVPFTMAGKWRIRYRLDGSDRDWSPATNCVCHRSRKAWCSRTSMVHSKSWSVRRAIKVPRCASCSWGNGRRRR